MRRQLRENAENWEGLAREDAFHAICTDRDKLGGGWTADEFFAGGRAEIAIVLSYLDELNLLPASGGRALDFGCGAGRLTQALARRFTSCDGVDISPTMIRLAEDHNDFPDTCHYHLNVRDDLSLFEDATFDFVYSSIVLQHIHSSRSTHYMRELVRLARPGGVILFQQPDYEGRDRWKALRRKLGLRRQSVNALLASLGLGQRRFVMEVYGVREAVVRDVLDQSGAELIDVRFTNSNQPSFNGRLAFLETKPERGVVSKQYCCIKRPSATASGS